MAKQDYSTEVGMWGVQPGSSLTPDAMLDTLVPHFEKVWDGHSSPAKRACKVLMTYGRSDAWGYTDPNGIRARQHARAYGEWLLRIWDANQSTGGAGAPRYLTGIVFRGMRNLTYVPPPENVWTPNEIKDMVAALLDYFISDTPGEPIHKGHKLTVADLPLLHGYLLADDFAKVPHDYKWDSIVQLVHSAQTSRCINRPFYFTNQIFDHRIWNNGAQFGQRFNGLKDWLNIFNSTGATPVFMPQYYPWEGNVWSNHDERDPYVMWDVALEELLYLKQHGYPSLRVQPIIQAHAGKYAGPGHVDMHNQLKAVLSHGIANSGMVDGVWLLNWNKLNGYAWTCYKSGDNRWTDKQHIAEAIQVEAGGSSESIITSVPCSTITGAEPVNFTRQTLKNKAPGGTRLEFNLDTIRPIRLKILSGQTTVRTQLDGYNWTGRQFSYKGPWFKGQYTRNPTLNPGDASLNHLHGTSINWSGWNEQDLARVAPGSYTVKLQNDSGGDLGGPITVYAQA